MISVFNLPVLIVVENNRYGEFTPIERLERDLIRKGVANEEKIHQINRTLA